jgi:hypothetical protein
VSVLSEKKMKPHILIQKPDHFRICDILLINAIGLVPGLLLGLTGSAGIILFIISVYIREPLSLLLAVTGLLSAGTIVFFMPAASGNPYVRHIVKKSVGTDYDSTSSIIWQASFSPRIYDGFRGFMEDADDIGYIRVSERAFEFKGSHISFSLPFDCVKEVRLSNIGWRGFWLYGQRIRILTRSFDKFEGVEFIERASDTIISSRRITKTIIDRINSSGIKTQA